MCGRQPEGVCGAPPQLASPKLSFFPQWYDQVTSYMHALGASRPLNTTPPLPRRSCESFLPPKQHSTPSVTAIFDAQGGALPQVVTRVAPKSVFGGTVSPSYQAMASGGRSPPVTAPPVPPA